MTDDITLPQGYPVGISSVITSLGLRVVNIHYTADPNKRDPAWKAHYRKGWDARDWGREFEIDWTIAMGEPVFTDFEKERHVSQSPLKAVPGHPIYIGWDVGLFPAAVFFQVILGQVRVFRCVTAENKTMITFAPTVIDAMLAIHREAGFPSWATKWRDIADRAVAQQEAEREYARLNGLDDDTSAMINYAVAVQSALNIGEEGAFEWEHYGDPYGGSRNDNDGNTTYKTCLRYGLRIKRGKQAWNTRRMAVSGRLSAPDIPGVGPALLISNDLTCDILAAGFGGGYKYPENVESAAREMPDKNIFSHPQDALQYPLTILFPLTGDAAQAVTVQATLRPLVETPAHQRLGSIARMTSHGQTPRRSAPTGWNPWIQSQSEL